MWGLNIFYRLLDECNNDNVVGHAECINKYENSVVGDYGDFAFPVPRLWNNLNPSTMFSFDNFRSSSLILFEIVSFFLIYMQLGAVVILTLFVR